MNRCISALLIVLPALALGATHSFESQQDGDGVNFASNGKTVSVHYVGKLAASGKVFDSTREDDGEPVELVVGRGEVLKCWDDALPELSVGQVGVLSCEPEVAYGAEGAAPQGIPPNAKLQFELEILEVKDAPAPDTPELGANMKGNENDPEQMFKILDRDRDRKLTAEEMHSAKLFAHLAVTEDPASATVHTQADLNKDGGVTEDEYLAYVWKQMAVKMVADNFASGDKNKDGKIDLAEYAATPHAFQFMGNDAMMEMRRKGTKLDFSEGFNSVDTDKDGGISAAELAHAERDWLTKSDTNGDGMASKEEWLAFAKVNHIKDANEDTFTEEVFGKLDYDKDGNLRPTEYHYGMHKMAEDMMAQGYGGMGGDL